MRGSNVGLHVAGRTYNESFVDPVGYRCHGREGEYSTCKEKRKLSLSLSKKKRFQETTEQDLVNLLKPEVPKNTDVSTRWAMKNFREWYKNFIQPELVLASIMKFDYYSAPLNDGLPLMKTIRSLPFTSYETIYKG